MTTERQAELIAKHGAFYLALYKGERSPSTPEQQRFVKNVRAGQSTNEHELAFLMWKNSASKPTPKPTPKPPPLANPNTSKKARNQGFSRKHTQPAYKGTTKAKWKQGWRTPDDMKGNFSPSKPKIIKAEPSGAQSKDPDKVDYDNIPTSQAHGSRTHRRVHRSIDRYGKPIDE